MQASKQAKSRGIILITIAINAKVIVVNTRRHREKEKNNKIIKNGKCDKISKEKYLKHAGYSANTNYFRLFVCLCVFWKQTNSDHKQTNKELSWPVLLFHCLLCSPLVVDLTSKTNVLSEMYFMLGVVCQIQLFITHTERWKQRDGEKSAKWNLKEWQRRRRSLKRTIFDIGCFVSNFFYRRKMNQSFSMGKT